MFLAIFGSDAEGEDPSDRSALPPSKRRREEKRREGETFTSTIERTLNVESWTLPLTISSLYISFSDTIGHLSWRIRLVETRFEHRCKYTFLQLGRKWTRLWIFPRIYIHSGEKFHVTVCLFSFYLIDTYDFEENKNSSCTEFCLI